MRTIVSRRLVPTVLLVTMLALSTLQAAEPPAFPQPQKEHELLKQFVGDWESELKASGIPGQPDMTCEGTIKSHMLGGFWVVNEMKSEKMSMMGLQTIGYDTTSKKYVGTWVDNMTNYMWKYEGTVDATGKILTLEAPGPNFMAEGKMAKFRDAYEFKSKDHIVMTSSMQGEDGKWIIFMTGQVKRKK